MDNEKVNPRGSQIPEESQSFTGQEFYRPENTQILQRIMEKIFTPEKPDDIEFFNDPKNISIAYVANHKRTGHELYIEYVKEDQRNRRSFNLLPIITLPAVRIIKSQTLEGPQFSTRFGFLPGIVTDKNRRYDFDVGNEYYFESNGRAIKHETIEKGDEMRFLDKQTVESTPQVNSALPETDSRFVCLDQEDYKYIQGLLEQFNGGEFKKGEYGANRPST